MKFKFIFDAEHLTVLDDLLSVSLSISKSKNLANSASPKIKLILKI